MVNRRTFIKALASAAMLPAVAAAVQPYSRKQAIANVSIPAGLKALTINDPDFFSYLNTYFPGLANDAAFAKLLPMAVMLTNQTGQPIYGLRLNWSRRTATGTNTTVRHSFLKRPSTQLKKRAYTGQNVLLGKAEIALVTPVTFWTANLYHAKYATSHFKGSPVKRMAMTRYCKWHPRGYGLVKSHAASDTVSVSIDAILFQSSTQGTAGETLRRRARNYRNAEHDEATKLRKSSLNPSGVLDATLLRHNIARSVAIGAAYAHPTKLQYVRARSKYAKKIMYLLNTTSLANVDSVLQATKAKLSQQGKLRSDGAIF